MGSWDWDAFISFENFKYEQGVTPFSEWYWPVGGVVGYLAVIFGLKYLMSTREAYQCVWGSRLHDVVLIVLSAAMTVGGIYGLMIRQVEYGWLNLWCDESGKANYGIGGYWVYIYHISKYYECIDTILIALRKKDNQFTVLHISHHAIMIFMTWTWLIGKFSLSQWGVVFNGIVHTLMYTYYLISSFHHKLWWKEYITMSQVIQFSYVCIILFLQWALNLLGHSCSGAWYTHGMSILTCVSWLFAFGSLYFKEARKRKKDKEKKAQ